jgi:CheY-like chemotaxis protein
MEPMHRVRVLIVEDDMDTRVLLRMILEQAGYSVSSAGDGLAALASVRASRDPLIVLLDWWLPRLDGLRVLQALEGERPRAARHAYVLVTAAYDDLVTRLDAVPPGLSVAVLAKPFGMRALLRAVEAAAEHCGGSCDPSGVA